METFDLVVIGAGPAGYVAALHARKYNLTVVCIEKEKTLGGTCLNIGCIPSKALLEATYRFEWTLNKASSFGILAKNVSPNFSEMMKKKQEVVKGLTQGIEASFKAKGVTSIHGSASFIDPYTIEVDGKKIKGKHFLIATGSEATSLSIAPFDGKKIISSTEALSLTTIPKKMVVIGAGAIGLEMASVYQRLGSKVTVVEMLENIAFTMDQQISRSLLQLLKKQGIEFFLKSKVSKIEGATVYFEQDEKDLSIEADVVLVAIGRRPNTKGLNLNTALIDQTSQGFIAVDNNFRTSQKHIFAIGDVIVGPMLAHKASSEALAVVDLIAGKKASINYLSIANVIYTHPEAASVGFTEEELKLKKINFKTGTYFFRANGRARSMDETEGFVKVLADQESGILLGMHILGSSASELIQEGVLAIENKLTVNEIGKTPHAHPTLSEVIMEACQSL